jgi:hypothetical protein
MILNRDLPRDLVDQSAMCESTHHMVVNCRFGATSGLKLTEDERGGNRPRREAYGVPRGIF